MKYIPDLEQRTIPTYEQLKNGLLDLIKQGKISREDAAMLLPELREGEDERIRKWIIEEFKIHYDFESPSLNPMVEKAIDWLEKQKEQKKDGVPKWRRIRAGEKLPCRAYLYKLAYETENNFRNGVTIDGLLVPNEPVRCGCDTWYLPADEVKNLPKDDNEE